MFVNDPPTDETMPLPILRARPSQPLNCTCANRSFRGLNTHYVGGRTINCSNDPSCPGCFQNMLPRWQGYVIVQSSTAKRWAILQFTPTVAAVLKKCIGGDNGLLGTKILITRLGERANSPLHCKITGFDPDVNEWSEYALESIVKRLFQIKGVKSPETISEVDSLTVEI